MKQFIIIIITLLFETLSYGQTPKEDAFVKTIREVMLKLSKRDSSGLSPYIDKKTGVYILYVIGVKRTYDHFTALGFSDTVSPTSLIYDHIKWSTLKYAALPTYDCGTEKWTKKGLYVDTVNIDHILSKITKFNTKYFKDNIPVRTILKFTSLEMKSRRIIVTGSNGSELIFYLSYIGKRWVLTIIDKVTCDCSV